MREYNGEPVERHLRLPSKRNFGFYRSTEERSGGIEEREEIKRRPIREKIKLAGKYSIRMGKSKDTFCVLNYRLNCVLDYSISNTLDFRLHSSK
jgi:hypothetical protein